MLHGKKPWLNVRPPASPRQVGAKPIANPRKPRVEPCRGTMIGRAMIKRIKALLLQAGESPTVASHDADELQVATAALLVEAALMDDHFDAKERSAIQQLLTARFELSEDATEALLETARTRVESASQLFGFTRVVSDRFSQEERVELMEMLWQVAYADGRLDDYEANLMRRISGLIHVSDRESGQARKRALACLGLDG